MKHGFLVRSLGVGEYTLLFITHYEKIKSASYVIVILLYGLKNIYKVITNLKLSNNKTTNDRKEVWQSKELHGRYYRALHSPDVDFLASVSWLRFGDLFGETEGFVCAIMDEVMMTNNYRK